MALPLESGASNPPEAIEGCSLGQDRLPESQAPELLPMKVRKSISDCVVNSWYMLGGKGEVRPGSSKEELAQEKH